ncbi:3-keto-disaccharide hydrolase [Pontibacter chitinilyticus]|uniref:3-keto-disaccharide hydrolase n=1 Tax=Pontibacter chitinilyticus TaxID=2674989 RepID=UPI00321B24C6
MAYLTKTILALLACAVLLGGLSSFNSEEEWTPLLDKNLSRWEMYLSYRHREGYKGDVPLDENGKELAPIGYNRNDSNVFSVLQENGEPVLRISGEIYGCLFTKQAFQNYDLKLKVKWGTKKWVPRTALLKDSGIVYHSIGKSGVDYWRSWMLGQEFQIMEGHMGDYWTIASSAVDIRAYIPEGAMNTVASARQPFLPLGAGTAVSGFCLRSEDRESPAGEWTEVELICVGDKSLHIINGEVVMVLQNSRYVENGKTIPLTSGKIQLQSEAAEVYYKDIKIRNLKEMPAKYAAYFK